MWVLNETTIMRTGRAWTDASGVQHPKTWETWSGDIKKKNGIAWVDEQRKPDGRFYDVSGINLDGSWSATLKDLDDLKAQYTEQTKASANQRLTSTDWQIIAKAERDRSVDSNVATYRAAVISKCTGIEAAIAGCKNMTEFQALFDNRTVDGKSAPPIIDDWPEIGE